MAPRSYGLTVDMMLAVFSEYVDGVLRVAGDMFASDDKGSGRTMPLISPLGLIARPHDPDTDQATGKPTVGAGMLTFESGGDMWCMVSLDPRVIEKMPPQEKGGTALYSYPGAIINLDGKTGSLLILVPSSDASKNHAISIDSVHDSFQLRMSNGMGISSTIGGKNSTIINNRGKANGASSDAYIEVNDDGIVLNGNLQQNGALVLGEIVSAQPVALHTLRFQFETQLFALVSTLASAVNILAPDPTIAPAVTALQTLLAQLATQGQSSKLSASP
jgi:hypothetical protein